MQSVLSQALAGLMTLSMVAAAASAAVLLASLCLPATRGWAARTRKASAVAAACSYGTTSALFLGLWAAFTPASWWFVAFLTVAWPLWMVSGLTGQAWMLDWLPPSMWLPR